MKNKLSVATSKIKLLNRQRKRLNGKLNDLLKEAKDKKMLDDNSYTILNNDFQNTFAHIVKNEKKNKDRPSNGKRYHEEVKRFAVTLFYHSPKAYDFCRCVYMHVFSLLSMKSWSTFLVKELHVFYILL